MRFRFLNFKFRSPKIFPGEVLYIGQPVAVNVTSCAGLEISGTSSGRGRNQVHRDLNFKDCWILRYQAVTEEQEWLKSMTIFNWFALHHSLSTNIIVWVCCVWTNWMWCRGQVYMYYTFTHLFSCWQTTSNIIMNTFNNRGTFISIIIKQLTLRLCTTKM